MGAVGDFFGRLFGKRAAPTVSLTDLDPYRYVIETGSKFPGGYGPTTLLWTDYWTLRARSSELFETNLYARGLIRRLVTNEINVGLHLEATPMESVLGYKEDELAEWSENVENRFEIWGDNAYLCDHNERQCWGALQQEARREALIAGDVLCVLRWDQRTKLPRLQLVNGAKVQTPWGYRHSVGDSTRIIHGVEIDDQGRHVGYWIQQDDGTFKRLPAFGEKSGKRIAWLLYGCDKRMDDVRGKPLLSLVLQSLKEIDRYRDSVQRKAVINSMLAVWFKKGKPGLASKPLTTGGGAQRRMVDTSVVGGDAKPRTYKASDQIPGIVIEELNEGEEPVAFPNTGTDERFSVFEAAVLGGVALGNEMPPEIYRLTFSNNYSASQAAINEFKAYLNKSRTTFGKSLCEPIYQEWLVSEVLAQRIEAPGLLDAWRDWNLYDKLGAWFSCDWSGAIKPAVDLSKLVGGYERLLDRGLITYDRAARELTGTKFSKNVRKLRREVLQLVEALKPMAELEALKKTPPANTDPDAEVDGKPDPDSEAGDDAGDEAAIETEGVTVFESSEGLN
jgi:capsid protein